MAVLIEGYSIVIRKKRVERKFPDGLKGFIKHVPNNTFCYDENFIRVGFMQREDFIEFSNFLEENGLTYIAENDNEAIDYVIVQQGEGFYVDCDWAELIHFQIDKEKAKTVMACRVAGSDDSILAAPHGWSYDHSFYSQGMYLNKAQIKANLKFVKREGNVEVYEHRETGQLFYVGRTSDKE